MSLPSGEVTRGPRISVVRSALTGFQQVFHCVLLCSLLLGVTPGYAVAQHGPPPPQEEVDSRPLAPCTILPAKESNSSRPFGPLGNYQPNTWQPAGVVPYEFDSNVSSAHQTAMLAAMREWEMRANVSFRPRVGFDDGWLLIQDSSVGNSSFVGKQGGSQEVNIRNWNCRFIMVHELGHALAREHEQNRQDRGGYVTINVENIDQNSSQCGGSCTPQFEPAGFPLGPYDFDSVMHYGAYDFSVNGQPTITVLAPNQQWQSLIGQRSHLSVGDATTMYPLYGPIQDCNANHIKDDYDIADGTSPDCNGNGVPDECENSDEPNDSLEQVVPLAVGSYSMKFLNRQDYFSITLCQPASLTVTAGHYLGLNNINRNISSGDSCGPASTDDLRMELLSAAGCSKATGFASTCNYPCLSGVSSCRQLNASLPSGTYVIHVWSTGTTAPLPPGSSGTGSPYQLTLSLSAGDGIGTGCDSGIRYVKPTGLCTAGGASWSDAYDSLQTALTAARVARGLVKQIWVAAGTYKPTAGTDRSATFQLVNGVALYGGFPATGNPTMAERNPPSNLTILSADLTGDDATNGTAGNSLNVVRSIGTDSSTVLDGFTIYGGRGDDNSSPGNSGAGLRMESSSATIRNCRFIENLAVYGGAVYNYAGSPTFANCAFQENSGVYDGGAVYNTNPGSPKFVNCTFSQGVAATGGAMWSHASSVTIFNCAFTGNWASERGGGLWNSGTSNAYLINCLFNGNIAQSRGGATFNGGGNLNLTNCTLSKNRALSDADGLDSGNGGSMTVQNCILDDGDHGQEIGLGWVNTTISWTDITQGWTGPGSDNISVNPEFVTGLNGNWTQPSLSFTPTIGNTGRTTITNGMSIFPAGIDSLKGKFINPKKTATEYLQWQIVANTQNTVTVNGNLLGLGIVNTTAFQIYDHHLASTSPCIDHTNSSFLPPYTVTDLDGNARFVDVVGAPDLGTGTPPLADLGCYEFGASGISRLHVNANSETDAHGADWATPFRYLQNALAAAALFRSVTEIWVAGGVYTPDNGPYYNPGDRSASFKLPSGVSCYGGFPATGTPTMADRNPAVHVTTLSGDLDENDGPNFANYANNAYQVVTGTGADNTALLDGFTIADGYADLDAAHDGDLANGAGMTLIRGGSPTVRNCVFTGNWAVNRGGGVHMDSGSRPMFANCLFSSNRSAGGAWSAGGAVFANGSGPVFTGCRFSGNHCDSARGGGLYSTSSSSIITGCIFSGNQAGAGGALYGESGRSNITNCVFAGNLAIASPAQGGGIFVNSGWIATVTNCTLTGNRGFSAGDDLYLRVGSSCALQNSIVWGDPTNQIFNNSGTLTVSYSDIRGGQVGIVNSGGTVNWGAGNLGSDPTAHDPKFMDLNSGDLRLSGSSPCIDAGNNTVVPAGTTTDLDSNPRFFDVLCAPDTGSGAPPIVDMGAYEFNSQIAGAPGDFNGDCHVDQTDVVAFRACLAGANQDLPAGCSAKDLDGDGDADLSDFGLCQRCYSGQQAADPNCGN